MVFERTLIQIVDENYVYARALHYLGISFFEDQEKSLRQICLEKKLDEDQVIKSFYDFDSNHRISFDELKSYPVNLLLEYLKHAHYQFIKERLPFITYVAKNCKSFESNQLLSEFVEDFIKHIYEEEDTVFKYVKALGAIKKGIAKNPIKELIPFRNFSLEEELVHHEGDDEMRAIRSIVESIDPTSLKERVLVNEVKSLHRELLYHAEIENKIFFPKAIELAGEVNRYLERCSQLN